MGKKRSTLLGLPDIIWIAIIMGLAYIFYRFGMAHFTNLLTGKGALPIPSSIVFMYMILTAIGVGVYYTTSTERMQRIFEPFLNIFRDAGGVGIGKKSGRILLCTAFPLIAGYYIYDKFAVSYEPEADPPGIHFDLPGPFQPLNNPFKWSPETVKEGSVIFIRNCQPCHGALADGNGWMARAWQPKPANFRESGTIAQLSERSLFWRITEGGIGLPPGSMGYRSVMPRWQDVLSEDDRWKVNIFEYVHAGQWPADVLEQERYSEPYPTNGEEIFKKKCWFCHGEKGDGKGPGVFGYGSTVMDPTPRDFTSGQFKIRTTAHGALPTDDDLFNAISKGLSGTPMPAWEKVLPEEDRRKVRDFIKTFSDRFKAEEAPKPAVNMAASEPSVTPAMIEKGKELFKKTKCFLCHGEEGRANGVITVALRTEWDIPFTARDLTAGWTYRGGNTMKDIFRTITTGLNGTPMGPYQEILTDEERWSLASFVNSISRPVEPSADVTVNSRLIQGEIPMDPKDPVWQEITPSGLELAGQMIAAPRQFKPKINHVRVRSVYNGDEIAFHFEWNDSSNIQNETLRDAIAIQFPTKTTVDAGLKPVLAMGNKKASVNIWHWKSFWKAGVSPELLNVEEPYIETAVKDMNAKGFQSPLTIQPPENQDVVGRGSWAGNRGIWQVVMKRKLDTGNENDVKFTKGKFTLFSLGIWDGSNGDIGSKKSVTVWYYVIPEEATPISLYAYTVVALIMAISAELWFVGKVRRNKSST